jgi:hypothetical protein
VLSDTKVRNAKPGEKGYRLPDGDGMHLFVTPKGAKIWRLRFDWQGKEQTLTLGSYPEVGLADARQRREHARKRLAAGDDPRVAPVVIPATPTLADIARRWPGWRLKS